MSTVSFVFSFGLVIIEDPRIDPNIMRVSYASIGIEIIFRIIYI